MAIASISRRRRLFECSGAERNQEARRKEILRRLQSLTKECQREIRKTERLMAFFEADLATIKSRPVRDVEDALQKVSEASYLLTSTVSYILGLGRWKGNEETLDDWRYRIAAAIYGWKSEGASVTPRPPTSASAVSPQRAATKAPIETPAAARDALAEAVKIATEAREASVTIDWSYSPRTPLEAEIRLKLIHQIEVEEFANQKSSRRPLSWVATRIRQRLLPFFDTVPADSEYIGADLLVTDKRWRAFQKLELKKETEARQARLRAGGLQ